MISFVKKQKTILRQALCLTAAAVLSVTVLTGCFGLDKPDPSASSDSGTLPNLIDDTSAPSDTTEATSAPTETTAPANVATVVNQVNVLNSPSPSGTTAGTLEVGQQVTVQQSVSVHGVSWVKIEYGELRGWVTADALDLSNVPDATEPDTTTPAGNGETTTPTQSSETKPNTTGGTTTSGGKKGVVTASELNIRSKAGTDGERVGQYVYGDRITITETSNGWGKTDKGWISLDYVYQDGATGSNPCKGLVTGTQLNVRSGPGTNYDAVGSMSKNDRVQILERIKIGNTTWGCTSKGWISMDYVYVDGTAGEGSGTGTVTGSQLNIRSGPGTNYDSVGSLNSGDTVKIYAQFTIGDMTWGCTDKGWVSMTYVDMN